MRSGPVYADLMLKVCQVSDFWVNGPRYTIRALIGRDHRLRKNVQMI